MYAGASLPTVNIMMDGQLMDFTGYLLGSSTVVPLRAIFETLGATIEWDGVNYAVTATKGNKVVYLKVGDTTAYVDGKPITLSVPPVLIDSRTFVPLRFVAESLDTQVGWIQETKTATISTGTECSIPPNQVHTGTIDPNGETWGRCGSPHIIRGTFLIEGDGSPILTITEGASIRFEAGARIVVGESAPAVCGCTARSRRRSSSPRTAPARSPGSGAASTSSARPCRTTPAWSTRSLSTPAMRTAAPSSWRPPRTSPSRSR